MNRSSPALVAQSTQMLKLVTSIASSVARALIVEDEGLIAMLIEDYLLDMGFSEVTIASSVADGLRRANDCRFDVVVLDVNLNGERSDPIAALLIERGVPFTFATGYGRAGLSEKYSDRPVATKPVQYAELREIIERLLSSSPS